MLRGPTTFVPSGFGVGLRGGLLLPFLMIIIVFVAHNRCTADQLPTVLLDTKHVLLFENSTTKKNTSFAGAMQKLAGKHDFFYVALGHPIDNEANLGHLRSYHKVHTVMASIAVSSGAVTFNRDLPPPDEKPEIGSSFFGSEHAQGALLMDEAESNQLKFNAPVDQNTANFDFLGMMAFDWNDCILNVKTNGQTCVHVIQIRNERAYYPKDLQKENLGPVFYWMRKRLQSATYLAPTVILFQNFSSEVDPLIQGVQEQLEQLDNPVNIIAIYFALQKKPMNVQHDICLKGQGGQETYRAPIVYFGGLNVNQYTMLQFNPNEMGARGFYTLDVRHKMVKVRDSQRRERLEMTIASQNVFPQKSCFKIGK